MPASSPPTNPEPYAAPRRRPILLGIAATSVLAGATIFLLLRAAMTAPEREHVLVIRSGPEWEGTELIVEGAADQTITGRIESAGNFTVPFFLSAGRYTLRVISQGQQIYTADVNLVHEKVYDIDLTRQRLTTRPSTRPTSQPQ